MQHNPLMKNLYLVPLLLFMSVITDAQIFESTNLPLVLIETNGQTIPDGYKIPAEMKIIFNEGINNSLTDSGNVYTGNIGIEIRGRYSASLPQKPYGIETRDASGNNLNVSLLGMPEENNWILLANYNDKSFVRNALAFQTFREMGYWASRTVICEVFVNDSYEGIYLLTEKIKIDKGRINIKKLDNTENTGDKVTGGYVFSVDYYENDYDSWLGGFSPIGYPGNEVYFVYNFPKPDEITVQQKAYIQNFVHNFEAVLYSNDFNNPAAGYRKYIDVASFIDYFIVSEVSRNVDGYKKSCFFNKDRDSEGGLLKAGPPWDFDWAWKNIGECYFGVTDGSGWAYKVLECGVWPTPTGWMPRLMEDPEFVAELKIRYSTLRKTTLSNTRLMQYIDSVNTLIAVAQNRHYQKWPILGQNVGAPEVDFIPATYAGETYKFKDWINTRLNWLDEQLLVPLPDGIDDIQTESTCRLFPNPTHEILSLDTGMPFESVDIFSYTGKLVLSTTNNKTSSSQINVSDLTPGIYIVKIRMTQGNILSNKLVID